MKMYVLNEKREPIPCEDMKKMHEAIMERVKAATASLNFS